MKPVKIDEVIDTFKTQEALDACSHRRRTISTSFVNNAILGLAESRNQEKKNVFFKNHQPDQKEWLYDFVWMEDDGKYKMTKLILVMESEWDHKLDDLRNDFQKLIVGRAAVKLFVFAGVGQKTIKVAFDSFTAMIKDFLSKNEDERYILAGFEFETKGNENWIFRVLDGMGESLSSHPTDIVWPTSN